MPAGPRPLSRSTRKLRRGQVDDVMERHPVPVLVPPAGLAARAAVHGDAAALQLEADLGDVGDAARRASHLNSLLQALLRLPSLSARGNSGLNLTPRREPGLSRRGVR